MSPIPDDRSFERSSEFQALLHELFLTVRTPIRMLDVQVQGRRVWSRELQARTAEQFEWGRDRAKRMVARAARAYTLLAFAAAPARSCAA